MSNYDDLNAGLVIQLKRLHECCAEQPVAYGEAAREASASAAAMERAKLKAKRARATDELRVRKTEDVRERFGIAKLTESSVAAIVETLPDVQAADDEYVVALELHRRWSSLVDAYEHRRSMLNNEVKLWAGEYFSDVDGGSPASSRTERAEAIQSRRRGEGKGDGTADTETG